jgi:hypothetical protein
MHILRYLGVAFECLSLIDAYQPPYASISPPHVGIVEHASRCHRCTLNLQFARFIIFYTECN